MAIKGAKNARIRYTFTRCTECNQQETTNCIKDGVCQQCRANKYGIMLTQVFEYELKNNIK